MVAPDSKDRSRNAIHHGLRPHKRKHRLHPHIWDQSTTAAYVPARENTAYFIYPWALSSSRSTESTTPLRCPSTKKHTDQTISLPPYRGVRLANSRYTQSCHVGRASIINHKTLLFNKSLDHCILACHTGNSCHATDVHRYTTSELVRLREGR